MKRLFLILLISTSAQSASFSQTSWGGYLNCGGTVGTINLSRVPDDTSPLGLATICKNYCEKMLNPAIPGTDCALSNFRSASFKPLKGASNEKKK